MASETLEESKSEEVKDDQVKETEEKEKESAELAEKKDEKEKEARALAEGEGDKPEETSKEDGESKQQGKGEDESPEAKKSSQNGSPEKGESESEKSGEEDEDKSGEETTEKEPVTPSTERPVRERKIVERYSAPSIARSSTRKPLKIPKGRGTLLKDIPNVAFKLSKRKADENLQVLHMILYGKKGKPQSVKRNIGKFSGFVWVENEGKQKAKVREKIDKCVKEKLMDFCDLLNIPLSKATAKKEELSAKLLEFLESPHATTDTLLADKELEKGRKRKATPSRSAGLGEASNMSAKKKRLMPGGGEKLKNRDKAEEGEDEKGGSLDTKDDSSEGSEETEAQKEEDNHEDIDSEDEDVPREKVSKKGASKKIAKEGSGIEVEEKSISQKKATPSKPPKKSSGSSSKRGTDGTAATSRGSSSKKQKVDKESSKDGSASAKEKAAGKKTQKSASKVSSKDQGKGKASKKSKEPSREEMHAVVVEILKKVDFNTATLSDILRQLGTHFGIDLMHRKAEVKDIITDVINNMSDEDDEEAEAGDDAEKDEDGDDN